MRSRSFAKVHRRDSAIYQDMTVLAFVERLLSWVDRSATLSGHASQTLGPGPQGHPSPDYNTFVVLYITQRAYNNLSGELQGAVGNAWGPLRWGLGRTITTRQISL